MKAKRFFSLLIAGMLTILLSGCGNAGQEGSPSPSTGTGTNLSFISGMGCDDQTCTDASHHHDCPQTCTDYDHHHHCGLDCSDSAHNHHSEDEAHHSDHH